MLLLTPECNVLELYYNIVILNITRVTNHTFVKMDYNFYVYKMCKRAIKTFFFKTRTTCILLKYAYVFV